jgi:hypothetical protein
MAVGLPSFLTVDLEEIEVPEAEEGESYFGITSLELAALEGEELENGVDFWTGERSVKR